MVQILDGFRRLTSVGHSTSTRLSHSATKAAVPRWIALTIAWALVGSGCASSAYRDVRESEATLATPEHVEEFNLDPGVIVLLDLTPLSQSTDEGAIGSFSYRPYELYVRCTSGAADKYSGVTFGRRSPVWRRCRVSSLAVRVRVVEE